MSHDGNNGWPGFELRLISRRSAINVPVLFLGFGHGLCHVLHALTAPPHRAQQLLVIRDNSASAPEFPQEQVFNVADIALVDGGQFADSYIAPYLDDLALSFRRVLDDSGRLLEGAWTTVRRRGNKARMGQLPTRSSAVFRRFHNTVDVKIFLCPSYELKTVGGGSSDSADILNTRKRPIFV